MTDAVVVLVTCANAREADRIAHALAGERLAACVNISQTAVESVYRWKGKTESAREVMLMMKTSKRLFARLERRVRELHSYEVPEIIALPVVAGSTAYLAWIEESVTENLRRRSG